MVREQGRESETAPDARLTTRGSAARLAAALLCLLVLGCVQGPETPIQSVGITNVSGSLEILGQMRGEETGAPGTVRKTEEYWLQESINALVDGYVYHPNLVTFSLGAGIGLVQRDYEEHDFGVTDGSDGLGVLNDYRVEATVLGKRNYPLKLLASREQGFESRLFRSSLRRTIENYGALWNLLTQDATINLQVNHLRTRLDALSPSEQDQEQRSFTVRSDMALSLREQDDLRIEVEHRQFEEDLTGLQYDYNRLDMRHSYAFGESDEHTLDSSLSYFNQAGSFDVEDFRWRELLRLQPEDSLDLDVGFELRDLIRGTRSGTPEIETYSMEVTGSVSHQLYQSLQTRLSGFARFIEYEPRGEEDELGLRLATNYRKSTGIGILSAGLSGEIRQDDRRNIASQLVEVIDESLTFQDPNPSTLNNENVVTTSIFVTSLDGATVYLEGVDYRIMALGQSTELERIVGGAILDGQTVLVDYLYDAGGSFRLTTTTLSGSVRHDFDFGLGVYYRYTNVGQSVDLESGPIPTVEDVEQHTFGLDYERSFVRAFAEYEDRDSNINAYERIRVGADFKYDFEWQGRATFGATWTRRQERFPQDRLSELLFIRGSYRQRVDDDFDALLQVVWRMGDDSVTGDDEGLDAEFRMNWRLRQLELTMKARYTDYESPFSIAKSWLVSLQLTRRF